MATLNLSYDTGQVPLSKITDAFATRFDYTTNANANETKAQFAQRMLGRLIIDIVKTEDLKAATAAVTSIALT